MKAALLSVAAAALIVAAAACSAGSTSNSTTPSGAMAAPPSSPAQQPMQQDGSMSTDTSMSKDGTVAKGDGMGPGPSMQSGSAMQTNPAMQGNSMMAPGDRYVDYSPETLAKALQHGRVVLFFQGKTDSASMQADRDLQANLASIPQDVTVLKVNADNGGPGLMTRYHVMGDPTFVQLDAQGNQVAQWMGAGLKDLLANLK